MKHPEFERFKGTRIVNTSKSSWKPSKFELRDGYLRASRDETQVGVGSRHITDLTARAYSRAITEFAHGDLLDAGCGAAPLYGEYAPLVRSSLLLDWPGSLHDDRFVDVKTDLNRPLPIDDCTVDTIVCSDVIEHVYSGANLISEFSRVLRPSGTLILGTPFMYALHEQPNDYFRWTPFALTQACEESSLVITRIEPIGGAIDVLIDVAGKLLALKSKPIAKAFVHGSSAVLKHPRLRPRFDRTGTTMPVSHLLVASKSSKPTGHPRP